MSWRDRMGPARFRGVAFFVETSERSGGRRGVTHEYPFRDQSYREDTGRKARSFPIEGYVLGADYITTRDSLLTALEDEGPGELVHPYYGVLRVAVLRYSIRETTADGGIARFSIEFEETPAQPVQPTAVTDSSGKLRATASAAKAAAGVEFLAKYSPGVHLTSLADSLRSATLAIDNAVEVARMAGQPLADMKRRIRRMQDSLTELVSTPADLLTDLGDMLDLFDDGDQVSAIVTAYDFDPGTRPPATTSNRLQEQTNFDALQRLVQRLVVIRAATLIPGKGFASYEEAIAGRNELADLIDDQAELATDDFYSTLSQLRADLTKAVPGESGDTPHLVSYTPHATVPSIVLAHRLYGDLDQEADILDRNHVRHPGFVPGGVALEVLTSE